MYPHAPMWPAPQVYEDATATAYNATLTEIRERVAAQGGSLMRL